MAREVRGDQDIERHLKVGGFIEIQDEDSVSTPASNAIRLRKKSGDGNLYLINSGGVEYALGSSTQSTEVMNASYVSNFGAETSTSGWSNSGANFTISRTTTSGEVLRGDASFKLTANSGQAINDYISHSFTLDQGDRNGRVLKVAFYYKGISNYDNGDCHIVFHDGSSEIIPSITSIPAGEGYFEATWVSTSASSYSIRFKAKVTTAFSLSVDDVYVGPLEVVRGGAIGPTTTYTPTITGSTSNPTLGTTNINRAQWARMGKYMYFTWELRMNATGTDGSGEYLIAVPSGLAIDNNYTVFFNDYSLQVIGGLGFGTMFDGVNTYALRLVAYDSTRLALLDAEGGTQFWGSAFGSMANSDLRIFVTGMVPIVGWEAEVILENARIEYLSNSGSADASDTTNFVSGIEGSVIPAITAAYKRRVQSAYPITKTDQFVVEVDWDGAGKWQKWERFYDDTNGGFGPTVEAVSGNEYQLDVWMRGAHYARFRDSDASNRSYTQENSAGSRWRVKIVRSPLAVESPHLVEEVEVSYVTSGSGGTATSGSENDCSLNTINNPKGYGWISGPSSNAITLSAGTYSFEGFQAFYNTGRTQVHIKNTTDSTYIGSTTGFMTTNTGDVIPVNGTAVLTKDTTIKMRYEAETTQSTDGLGIDAPFTPDSTFTKLKIQRLGP